MHAELLPRAVWTRMPAPCAPRMPSLGRAAAGARLASSIAWIPQGAHHGEDVLFLHPGFIKRDPGTGVHASQTHRGSSLSEPCHRAACARGRPVFILRVTEKARRRRGNHSAGHRAHTQEEGRVMRPVLLRLGLVVADWPAPGMARALFRAERGRKASRAAICQASPEVAASGRPPPGGGQAADHEPQDDDS